MIIYLAGPIRPKGDQTLEGNVAKAKRIALELWLMGYVVVCPHANTDLPMAVAERFTMVKWLEGDLEILARCDALVVLEGWEQSMGTRGEICFAREEGIPVYFYPELPMLP